VLYAAKERRMEIMSKLHADLRREMLGDLDSTVRASMLDLLGGERPTQLRQVLSAQTDAQHTSEDDIKSEEGDGLHRKNAKNKSIIKQDIGTSKDGG
jgi:Mg/Co/Ni transporter MgtE